MSSCELNAQPAYLCPSLPPLPDKMTSSTPNLQASHHLHNQLPSQRASTLGLFDGDESITSSASGPLSERPYNQDDGAAIVPKAESFMTCKSRFEGAGDAPTNEAYNQDGTRQSLCDQGSCSAATDMHAASEHDSHSPALSFVPGDQRYISCSSCYGSNAGSADCGSDCHARLLEEYMASSPEIHLSKYTVSHHLRFVSGSSRASSRGERASVCERLYVLRRDFVVANAVVSHHTFTPQ